MSISCLKVPMVVGPEATFEDELMVVLMDDASVVDPKDASEVDLVDGPEVGPLG